MRRVSKRSLGLILLAIAYCQVAVGFIATGGTSGLLRYGYHWARSGGIPADDIVGWVFVTAAAAMIVTAVGRHWHEPLASIGYGAAVVPVTVHMVTCCIGALLGDLDLIEYMSAFGSQVGIVVILLLLHDWPDPRPAAPLPPEEPPHHA